MSNQFRREGLGRNRRSPVRRGFSIVHLIPPAMIVGVWFGYAYLTEPHRVFAKKHLECDPWEVTWSEGVAFDLVRGCGRSAEVVCGEDVCVVPAHDARVLE